MTTALTNADHARLDLWVKAANNVAQDFTYPFTIDGARVGRLIETHYFAMLSLADLFEVGDGMVGFRREVRSIEQRSDAFAEAIDRLVESGQIAPNQIRGELYGAMESWGETPSFVGERAGFAFFGLRSFGVHIHGLTGSGQMWLGRRAPSKNTDPGKLDQLAAGGQPIDVAMDQNVIKECWEEAGVPEELAATSKAAGVVPIRAINPLGFQNLDLHIYDLVLPDGFTPENQDGEVSGFERFQLPDILAMLIEDADEQREFPVDVAVCLIEFLARQGLVDEQQFSHPIRR